MMPIIFLDIDGVLNHRALYQKLYDDDIANPEAVKVTDIYEHFRRQICPLAIGRLNRIVEETGAEIVISSVWRTNSLTVPILRQCELKTPPIGSTPILNRISGDNRWLEIQEWILFHPQYKGPYISIDDSDLESLGCPFNIKCDALIGLTDELVDLAIERLKICL